MSFQPKLVYVASPYSHEDPAVVEHRMEIYSRIDAKLIAQGLITISPLMKHHILKYEKLPGDWAYWQRYSETLLQKCDALFIICLDGWKTSTGVQAELALAIKLGLPVTYLNESGEEIDEPL